MGTAGSCKDCPDRYSGCHDVCDSYQKRKAEREERNAAIKEAKSIDSLWRSYAKDSLNRHNKKKW